MLKMLFYAWLEDYKESRKAKHWFNREAGIEGEGEDENDWYWPEGNDPISLLPRDIAVKVQCVLICEGMWRCCIPADLHDVGDPRAVQKWACVSVLERYHRRPSTVEQD